MPTNPHPRRPSLLVPSILCLLASVAIGGCGNEDDRDEPTSADVRPANDALSASESRGDAGTQTDDLPDCAGITNRFWPDTADCDPACHLIVDGLIFDETRGCYGPSEQLTTPLACLRDGLAGAALACQDVPELGHVMTVHSYPALAEEYGDCGTDWRRGFPCTE